MIAIQINAAILTRNHGEGTPARRGTSRLSSVSPREACRWRLSGILFGVAVVTDDVQSDGETYFLVRDNRRNSDCGAQMERIPIPGHWPFHRNLQRANRRDVCRGGDLAGVEA